MNMCKGTEFTLTPEFQSEDYRKDRSKYYYVIVLEYKSLKNWTTAKSPWKKIYF